VKLLLDTHLFLWWCADDPQLTERERAAIRSGANEVFLSAASVWDMAIKQALGRLEIPEPASAAAAYAPYGCFARDARRPAKNLTTASSFMKS
jgi:PIN domain nuclease of toxin-antitoxin system